MSRAALDQWLQENKMNPAFQISELCRIFDLKMVSGNGIISFEGGDGGTIAKYLSGRAFNFNLEEIVKEEQKQESVSVEEVEPEPEVKLEVVEVVEEEPITEIDKQE